MLVIKKTGVLIRKKKPLSLLKKNIKLSWPTISLIICQKRIFSLPTRTFVELKAIIFTNGYIV